MTDHNIQVINGLTLIRFLRELATYQYLIILMLTTEYSDQMKEAGKNADAFGWVVNQFDTDRLISLVRKVLGA